MGEISSGQEDGFSISNATISSQVLERVQREMSELFRYANVEHPAMRTLQQLCIARRVRQLSGKI